MRFKIFNWDNELEESIVGNSPEDVADKFARTITFTDDDDSIEITVTDPGGVYHHFEIFPEIEYVVFDSKVRRID